MAAGSTTIAAASTSSNGLPEKGHCPRAPSPPGLPVPGKDISGQGLEHDQALLPGIPRKNIQGGNRLADHLFGRLPGGGKSAMGFDEPDHFRKGASVPCRVAAVRRRSSCRSSAPATGKSTDKRQGHLALGQIVPGLFAGCWQYHPGNQAGRQSSGRPFPACCRTGPAPRA